MSSYQFNTFQQSTPTSHSSLSTNHTNRNRRVLRLSHHTSKHSTKNTRKEEEPIVLMSFRRKYEAGRSFDLDDDMEFCPGLITECDMFSINSASSDRASLSSQSPMSSPPSYQVSPTLYVNSNANLHSLPYQNCSSPNFKLDQPSGRVRNPILIVNPNANNNSNQSGSGRIAQNLARRW